MKPNGFFTSSLDNDIDRMTAPYRSLIDISEKINGYFHSQALNTVKDLAAGHDTFRNTIGMAETIEKITKSWVTPTDPKEWVSLEPIMERWNEVFKPQLEGVSVLSSPMLSKLSAIDTAYEKFADWIHPMKPLTYGYSTIDFMTAAVADMDLTDEDEAAVEDGLTIISEEFSTYVSGIAKGFIQFEAMVSELQLKIDAKFKRHPLILPLLMFIIAYYGNQLLDSFNNPPKAEPAKIEKKVSTPRKKKIVYTNASAKKSDLKKAAN